MIETQKFVKNTLYVDAVQITFENFEEVAAWCQGKIQQDDVPGQGKSKKYIRVRVHHPKNKRQTQAFVGDWLLYTTMGYKVYTDKAFLAAFSAVEEEEQRTYPYEEGGYTVLGPEVLYSNHYELEVIAYKGKNFVPQVSSGLGKTADPPKSAAMNEAVRVIESEGGEVLPATPEGIAQAVQDNSVDEITKREQERIKEAEKATEKRVLSFAEQKGLGPDEIKDLLRTGEVILEQDVVS